jgi:hypothetical protein
VHWRGGAQQRAEPFLQPHSPTKTSCGALVVRECSWEMQQRRLNNWHHDACGAAAAGGGLGCTGALPSAMPVPVSGESGVRLRPVLRLNAALNAAAHPSKTTERCSCRYLRVDPEAHCVLCSEPADTSAEARQQHAEVRLTMPHLCCPNALCCTLILAVLRRVRG